jgi:hypothetical protein
VSNQSHRLIPSDLAGFQQVVFGRVQEGDLIIPARGTLGDAWWAGIDSAYLGETITEGATGTYVGCLPVRVYRNMTVPEHDHACAEAAK